MLITDPGETYDVRKIVDDEILQGKIDRVEELNYETGRTRFRFGLRYLDRIILCLPRCDLSPAIRKFLSDKEEERLNSFPKPKIKWPLMKKGAKLRRYQEVGAAMVVDKAYAARCGYPDVIPFLNDGLGLGKSYQAAAAMAYMLDKAQRKGKKYPMLVVCPNNVKLTWMLKVIEECFEMSVGVLTGSMSFGARQALIDSEPDVLIVNFEAIRATPIHKDDNVHKKIIGWRFSNPALFVKDWHRTPDLMEKEIEKGTRNLRRYGMIVIDEHHTIKTPDAQVTRGFFQLRAKKWLMMSGTPILNRPEEIWTCLHKLWPKSFPSYQAFVKSLSSGSSKKAYSVDAMAELRGFLQSVSLRRRKEHVLKDLPKAVKVVRKIEMTPEQRKLYERIENDFELVLDSGEVKSIMGVLPQITRLKQASFSPELYEGSKKSAKMVELRKIVEELVAEGEKAIIFSQWSTATRIIERELKEFNPAYVTGEIKSEVARHAEQERFNNDPSCHLYIGTIQANREGVNLGAGTYVIFTDTAWSPGRDIDQPVGRSAAGGLRGEHFGPDQKVHVIYLQMEGSIEEWIDDVLAGKRGVFDRMIERDGGAHVKEVTVKDIARLIKQQKKLRRQGLPMAA